MTVDPATVRKAAETLLAKHGLTDWRFEWDNTLGRSGQTRYNRKTITYSMNYLGSPPHSIVNTLLPRDRTRARRARTRTRRTLARHRDEHRLHRRTLRR